MRFESQVGFFAAVCLGVVGLTASAVGATLEPVSVRLDWLPGADHAPLYVAKDRGYYAEQGLDVKLNGGQGSLSTLQVVGSGNEDIGIAGMAALVTASAKGIPVIAIAGIVQRSPDSIISLKSSPIRTPHDLEGKRWGAVPGDEGAQMFTAFSAVTNINLSSIHKVSVSAAASRTSLLNGDVDFIVGWTPSDAVKISRVKPINEPMMFVDYGLSILGSSIFVTRNTLTTRADMLKRFMIATRHAADDIVANPQIGWDAVIRAKPELDRELLAAESKAFIASMHTANSTGHPYGWISPVDLGSLLEMMKKFYEIPASVTREAIYTDAFAR
jgi:NitT/TauT family transport system substrate-binding protein